MKETEKGREMLFSVSFIYLDNGIYDIYVQNSTIIEKRHLFFICDIIIKKLLLFEVVMIRESNSKDLEELMKLWLGCNIEVHSFIQDEYWKNNYHVVKEAIAEGVTVYEEKGNIIGFIGVRVE